MPPLSVWPLLLLLIPGLLHLVALQAGRGQGKASEVCVCVLWLGQEALGSTRGGEMRLFRAQGNVSSVGGGAEGQELSAFL